MTSVPQENQTESWISVQVTHCTRGMLKHNPNSIGTTLHPTVKHVHQGRVLLCSNSQKHLSRGAPVGSWQLFLIGTKMPWEHLMTLLNSNLNAEAMLKMDLDWMILKMCYWIWEMCVPFPRSLCVDGQGTEFYWEKTMAKPDLFP